ncbi:ABC transporter ATP-binding protein [Magnetospirillum fulvum]|uniref:Sulfate-transporting ATPase n=1 Tax=Magnetospirillum fulvum TaxID=1082 RepID=A0A1H6HAT8_MAGFU|nr:ABC transporter ATP-binding protein [Magnetospirillum fulvum]SEH32911.1 sulfate-transporting ATPase [Magnetospirillum fulvum]
MTDGTSDQGEHPAHVLLVSLLSPEKVRLGLAVALAPLAALADLLPYAILSYSVGAVVSGTASPDDLVGIAGLVGAALVLKYLLYSLAYYFSHVAAFRLLADIRQTLVRRLAAAPMNWLHRHSSGHLKKIVVQDVERLEQFIAHHTVECLAAISSPLFVALVLAWIDWRLAAAALVTVPLAALAQAALMRGLGPRIDAYNRAIGDLNGAAVEYVRNAPVMKAFGLNAHSFRRMSDLLARYHDLITAMTRQTVPGWSVFMVLLGANLVFLLPVSLWLVRQGTISPAETILALTLGSVMLKPLFKVAHFSSEIREIAAGLRRIAPLLAFAPSQDSGPRETPPTLRLSFRHVSFAYESRPILKDVSFTLEAGTVTALVGPSGAGKSTIAHLIGGLAAPSSGDILVNGTSLSALDEAERSAWITVAAQDAFLFRGTLLENVRLGRPDATDDDGHRAARIAQVADFVATLSDGFATMVGEQGARLSGGERQRIAIARALLTDAPLLVLDEATAFADSRTERRFYQSLREAYPAKTLLIIAHRLSSIERADQILVLKDGGMVDCGRHADLIARCPLYRALWQRQFDSETWTIRPGATANAALS